MGLFVHAISKSVFVHQDDKCSDGDHYRISSPEIFKERLDGLEQGCYICKGKEQSVFSVTYMCYGAWRELLSRSALGVPDVQVVFEREKYKRKPFFELILMSGTEGAIGPVTSKKLAEDFKTHSRSIKKIIPELIQEHGFYPWDDKKVALEQWLYMYSSLKKAFVLASKEGFVRFC